jgi:hypothetical protein
MKKIGFILILLLFVISIVSPAKLFLRQAPNAAAGNPTRPFVLVTQRLP